MTNSFCEITFLLFLCNREKGSLSRWISRALCKQRIMNFELIYFSKVQLKMFSNIQTYIQTMHSLLAYTGITHTFVWHRFHINWGSNPISLFKQLSGLHGVTCTPTQSTLCALAHTHTSRRGVSKRTRYICV